MIANYDLGKQNSDYMCITKLVTPCLKPVIYLFIYSAFIILKLLVSCNLNSLYVREIIDLVM